MQIFFVLVEPVRAANVGAAARALKTMGFSQLVLVNSTLHSSDEARWLAHGATDILEQACVLPDMASLRAQCDLLIATTARERGSARHYHTPDALNAQLQQQQGSVQRVGIVFGPEDSGLSNEALALCDLWSCVPLAGAFPSLNLAQAVMVYTYALSNLVPDLGLHESTADTAQLQHLLNRVLACIEQEIPACDPKLQTWLRERLPLLSDRDVKMAHQLLTRWLAR
jgi:tRNA/rRNA methyltransferase